MVRQVEVYHRQYPLKNPFKIAHGTRLEADVVEVVITENGVVGSGECVPYERYGESISGVMSDISQLCSQLESGMDKEALQLALPAGAARHAIDSALWELSAKQMSQTIGVLSGLGEPGPVDTAFTLVIDSPEAMSVAAKEAAFGLLKLKFAGDGLDGDRLKAVRIARPDARLIIDANESWTPETMPELVAYCVEMGVELIEQPLPAGADDFLATIPHPIPICADESCHTSQDLAQLKGRYDVVNIKLDKTGGLTHAIELLNTAKDHGFEIMVGCMVGSALSLRDAYPLAPYARWVDLDAIYLLAD